MKTLFENIDGSCPVRDPRGKEFLRKVLSGEIRLDEDESSITKVEHQIRKQSKDR